MKTLRSLVLRSTILAGIALGAMLTIGSLALAGGGAHAGGACRGMPLNDEATMSVVIDEAMCFQPEVIRVQPGSMVTWQNPASGIPHAVTGSNLAFGDYSGLGTGASVSHTFDEPGVYPYYCYLHPGMVGTVIVGDVAPSNESVSLAGGAGRGATNGIRVSDDDGGFDSIWLIIPVAAVAAIVTGGAGYALGTRRVKL
jgi:plastocyanin